MLEVVLLAAGLSLAVLWIFDRSGTYEPALAIVSLLLILVEAIRRRLRAQSVAAASAEPSAESRPHAGEPDLTPILAELAQLRSAVAMIAPPPEDEAAEVRRRADEIQVEATALVEALQKSLADSERWLGSDEREWAIHDGHLREAELARARISELLLQGPPSWTWYRGSEVEGLVRRLDALIGDFRRILEERNEYLMNQP